MVGSYELEHFSLKLDFYKRFLQFPVTGPTSKVQAGKRLPRSLKRTYGSYLLASEPSGEKETRSPVLREILPERLILPLPSVKFL